VTHTFWKHRCPITDRIIYIPVGFTCGNCKQEEDGIRRNIKETREERESDNS